MTENHSDFEPMDLVGKLWDDAIETIDPSGLSPEELDNMVHTLVARRLVERLQRGDCTAGDIQCALRFLKDNDVTGLAVPGSAQAELRERLGDSLPFKLTGTGDAG